MCFDFAPLLFYDAAQFALHRLERIVDYFLERFVDAIIHLLFIRNQLVPGRHGHIDAAPVGISFLVSVISLLDGYVTAVDVIAKSLKAAGIIQNEIFDLVRFFQTTVGDLNGQLHNYLDITVLVTRTEQKFRRCIALQICSSERK